MKDIKVIKDSLKIIESKYVNSKQIDENSYKITFTYKNMNYSLDINKKYKFMMLTITESIYRIDMNEDTLELVDYIKNMISFTEFEDYNVFSFSCRKEIVNNEIHDVMQVIKETNDFEAIIDSEIIRGIVEENETSVIEYKCGLNTFDKRLFVENIFDDFNEKISLLNEEDLFLIYTTLLSYFYKLINNLWKGEKIDPYVIDDMLIVIYNEIQKRLNNQNYDNWFNEWNNHFDENNIEEYLKSKEEGKNKKIKY